MTAEVSARLRFAPDGTLTVLSGKVELGQGLRDALTLICSTELSLDARRIRVRCGDTGLTPDDGLTAGSNSMEQTGAAVRAAAVAARNELLRRAAARWQAPPGEFEARAGRVRRRDGEGAALDYWELLDAGEMEDLPPAPREERAPAGRVAALVSGCDTFVHDLRLPGMAHGRVLRPSGYGRRLTRLDDRAAGAMRGVLAVVVDGSFAGVVAEREEQAIAARDVLAGGARWQAPADAALPASGRAALAEAAAHTTPILDRGTAPAQAVAATLSATYSRPFLLHAALGPSAAAARLDAAGRLTVWSHTQGPFQLRAALADALAREPAGIRVIHVDGAGCYGHNGADDAALDAALLALAVPGRPVLVKWTRTDENRWEPFGSAMIVTCAADLDAAGSVLHWRHEVRSYPHGARPRAAPGHSALLAAWHRRRALAPPPVSNSRGLTAGPQRNAATSYPRPRCESPPCAASAPTPTCSPPSRSWMSWQPSPAPIRCPIGCATCATTARVTCWPRRSPRRRPPEAGGIAGAASGWRATRTCRATSPWCATRRWIPAVGASASNTPPLPPTPAASSIATVLPTSSKGASCRPRAGR